jgi:integrase
MAKKRGFGSVYHQKRRGLDGNMVSLPTWWIKYSKGGQIFRESSGSYDRREAEKLLKKRLGEVVTGRFGGLKPERIKFVELANEVIEDYRENERATIADVERRLRLHLLPELGEIRAADFGTRDLKCYITKRRKDGAENATINRELAIVKRAFRLAATSDPPLVNRIPRISLLEENNVRKGFLEHEAYIALRNELPDHLKAIFVIGFHTGARVGELEDLVWPRVELYARRIVLQPGETKNREGRALPIYGEMLEWLRMAKVIRDAHFPSCPYVFSRNGERLANWRDDWDAACERAGVAGVLFHDLRRTAVRNMVRAGIPEKVAMQISGHKTRSIFDRYNIVNERDLSDAAAKMDRHLSGLGILSGILAAKEEEKRDGEKPATPLQ